MERYAYLALSLSFAVVLGILLLIRKDLAKLALLVGGFGGAAAFAAEVFYFRDYWRPPSLFGTAVPSPEDFIFGFSITALAVITFLVLGRKRLGDAMAPHGKTYLLLFVCGVLSMLIFNVWLGVNSIFVSSITFLAFSLVMLSMRRNLIVVAAYSAVALTLLTLIVYIVLFDFFFKDFWQRYWLLHDTSYGLFVFGNVPLTELLWYFSWAIAGSVSYPFLTGKEITDL